MKLKFPTKPLPDSYQTKDVHFCKDRAKVTSVIHIQGSKNIAEDNCIDWGQERNCKAIVRGAVNWCRTSDLPKHGAIQAFFNKQPCVSQVSEPSMEEPLEAFRSRQVEKTL